MNQSDELSQVTDLSRLQDLYPAASWRAQRKCLSRLDPHCRTFISRSPFVIISSQTPGAGADCSPRGDEPGFVSVLDEKRILVPDRPGNNRLDTARNVLINPSVGTLFLIPGVDEMLRINGRAFITDDQSVLGRLTVKSRAPRTGLVIEIDEVFLHCAKSAIRSGLWRPDLHGRGDLPPMARMLADQIPGLTQEESFRLEEQSLRDRLY